MNILKIIILVLITSFVQGQNLVPNAGFEEYITCPSNINEFNKLQNWYCPNDWLPDYFNSCCVCSVGVPYNFANGFQNAKSGNGYVGIYAWSYGNNLRDYIQVRLLQALISSEKYKVSFFINKHNSHRPAINQFGLYFSVDSFHQNNLGVLNYTPQINYNNFITDTLNWTLIQGSYQATGGERFITIGNFFDDSNTDTIMTGGIYSSSYYYIDDVFVGLDTTVNSSEMQLNNESIQVFPNPANDLLSITYSINNESEFELFDILGKKVLSHKLCVNINNETVSLKGFADGIYYYKIKCKNKIIKSDKLLIVK